MNISIAVVQMSSEFGWGMRTQARVLSCFFYGYVATQVPGSVLAAHFGGERVLAAVVFSFSTLSILSPVAAAHSVPALLACRVSLGLAEGMAEPTIYHILSRSVSPTERGRMVGLLGMWNMLGTVVALCVSPLLQTWFGWHSTFYFFGALGYVWVAAWCSPLLGVAGMPGNDAGTGSGTGSADDAEATELLPTGHEGTRAYMHGRSRRWRIALAMCTHRASGVVFLSHFCLSTAHWIATMWLPTYFAKRWHMRGVGLSLTMMPHVCMMLALPTSGSWADALLQRGHMTPLRLRRTFNSVGFTLAACFFLLVPLARSPTQAMLALSAALASSMLTVSGYELNKFELAAPQLVGMLHGISQTVGNSAGVVSVQAAAAIVEATGSWDLVFVAVAVALLTAAAMFHAFSSTQRLFDV